MKQNVNVSLTFHGGSRQEVRNPVAVWAAEHVWTHGDFSLSLIDLAALPAPSEGAIGDDCQTRTLCDHLRSADAFVLVVPEQADAGDATLQRLIDAADGAWQAKAVAFVSYGGRELSVGLRAVERLRLRFAELHAVTVADEVSFAEVAKEFDTRGEPLRADQARASMAAMLEHLKWWSLALREARQARPYAAPVARRSHRRALVSGIPQSRSATGFLAAEALSGAS